MEKFIDAHDQTGFRASAFCIFTRVDPKIWSGNRSQPGWVRRWEDAGFSVLYVRVLRKSHLIALLGGKIRWKLKNIKF